MAEGMTRDLGSECAALRAESDFWKKQRDLERADWEDSAAGKRAAEARLDAATEEMNRVITAANAEVIELRDQLQDADTELHREMATLRAEVGRLRKSEAEWKYWRGTAVKACDRAESRLAAANELLRRTHRENVLWSGTGTTQLARDIDAHLAAQPAAPPWPTDGASNCSQSRNTPELARRGLK